MMRKELTEGLDYCTRQIRLNIPVFEGGFPHACSESGIYRVTENDDWTEGFWTGMNWLAYEWSKETEFWEAAMRQVKSFRERLDKRVVLDHHDMGFLFSPSCMAACKLTGSSEAEELAIAGADILMTRFQEKGQFFQAWGKMGERGEYRYIIDSMINMPLLFQAADITGDSRYSERARQHLNTVMRHSIRADASVYHAYYFDPETGQGSHGATHQGNRPESVWARGQAWAVYGTALAYTCTKDENYARWFERLAVYFMSHLPEDGLPYWDFDFQEGSREPRDSSAAAIAVCGFLEMAVTTGEEHYRAIALDLLFPLLKYCIAEKQQAGAGILLHGTYARSSAYNGCENIGVDEYNLWGDYFFMEALFRSVREWDSYWTP